MDVGLHRGIMENEHTTVGSNQYEKVETFKYLGSLTANKNSIYEEIKSIFKAGNSLYYSIQTLVLSKNL